MVENNSVEVPNDWILILNHLLVTLSENPNNSATQFVINHREYKRVIDELINRQFIERDHQNDTLKLHLMALWLLDHPTAQLWLNDIEQIYLILRNHFIESPDTSIQVATLLHNLSGSEEYRIQIIRYFCNLGISGYSTDLNAPDAYILPTESILITTNMMEILDGWAVSWFPEPQQEKAEEYHTGKVHIRSDETKLTASQKVAARKTCLREMLKTAEEGAKNLGKTWDSESLPITIKDFHKIFYELYPNAKRVKPDSLKDDVHSLHYRFQKGTGYTGQEEFRALLIAGKKDIFQK